MFLSFAGLEVVNGYAEENARCRIRFAVVHGNANGRAPVERATWPDGGLLWWISEGEKKYSGICYNTLEEADFVVTWERRFRMSTAVSTGPDRVVEGGCTPRPAHSPFDDIRTADPKQPVIPPRVVPANIEACQAMVSDASISGREGKSIRINRPRQTAVSMERIAVAVYRAPISQGQINKPIKSFEKDANVDPRKSVIKVFKPVMKALKKQADKQKK